MRFYFGQGKKIRIEIVQLVVFAVLAIPGHSYAELAFDNLDRSDFTQIINELSANFNHTTISGASTAGTVHGFEVGVAGAMTNSPDIERLVREVDPSTTVNQLYDIKVIGLLSVPMGFTAEVSFLPNINMADFEFRQMGVGLKWTATETLITGLPVELALRAQYSTVNLAYAQGLDGLIRSDVEYEGRISGFGIVVSKKLPIAEPYFGLAMLSGAGELNVVGTGSIFDNTFTTGQSASATETTTALSVGAEVNVLLMKLGLEFSSLFGTSRIGGKVSFFF